MRLGRKGFAIILVASLAGLIFLLGASLVAVSRLQSAAANYDQRVRLAREHARAALDIALAELQGKMGPDTSVSYYADALRADYTSDFKEADPVGVREPFWTAARKGSQEPSWLVTKRLDGTVDSPIGTATTDQVEILSKGTIGANARLSVRVPKEAVETVGVQGYDPTETRTIGHYGYWVGDLGTKASYALYDKAEEIDHGRYDADRQARVRQLGLAKPQLPSDGPDTNELGTDGSFDNSNPPRIDAFVSDFQFYSRYGDSSEEERYLLGLSESKFQAGFQDFTPLSRGLMVNTRSGRFRKDLSAVGDSLDSTYNADYQAYTRLAQSAVSFAVDGNYNNHAFPIQAGELPIMPVITELNLNYSVYLGGVASGDQDLYISYALGVELWNPFTSAIDLGGNKLVLTFNNLPTVEVNLEYTNVDNPSSLGAHVDLSDSLLAPVFEIGTLGSEANILRPGQVAYYRGPSDESSSEGPPFILTFGENELNDSRSAILWKNRVVAANPVTGLELGFRDTDGVLTSDFSVTLSLQANDLGQVPLATYTLPGEFSLNTASVTGPNLLAPDVSSFGFSWKVSDAVLTSSSTYHPLDSSLDAADLENFDSNSGSPSNLSPFPSDALIDLLGFNPSDTDINYDLAFLQLPKQELSSVAQLSNAYSTRPLGTPIGEPGSTNNRWFDDFFFSTIPKPDASIGWESEDPVPNAGYKPVVGATELDLRDVDSAEHLFVHGMFNIHSTSIDAWAALLKSIPASSIPYWENYFAAVEGERYLMFNRPLGGEDLADFSIVPDSEQQELRDSLKQSVFAFTEAEIETLASNIVSNIRQRVQGASDSPYNIANNGPFTSLQDFVDSGVLKNAINDAGVDFFTPSWVIAGTAADFRQSTILNLIGAYISPRSDTFLIRAYGDTVNPADASKIWARAYCEAIVQRVHEPHADLEEVKTFEVVAFRWLSGSEI